MRQIHTLKVRLLLLAGDHRQGFSEISLRVSRRMNQRHKHLLVPEPRLAHVILHHGIAAAESVLSLQPVPDALGSVPLLLGLRPVVHQDLVDDPQPRPQLGTLDGFLPFIARRQRKLQHLPDGLPRQTEVTRRLPDAHAVHLYRSSYACIHFHLVHLPGVPQTQLPCNVLELKSVVVYFGTATNRRSRGASWSIIAPPFISPKGKRRSPLASSPPSLPHFQFPL